jgi:hypothetical protein
LPNQPVGGADMTSDKHTTSRTHESHIQAARAKAVRVATANAGALARDAYETEYARAFPAIFEETFREELGLAPKE